MHNVQNFSQGYDHILISETFKDETGYRSQYSGYGYSTEELDSIQGKICLYMKRNLNGYSIPPLPTSHSMDKRLPSRGKIARD
jgi:hypothetical protein